MTAIEDRITAVLEKHKSWDGGFTWSCHCGVDFHDEDDHPAHVAAAVVAALGLQLTTGGQYATFGLQLSDEELDQAGFTYHRTEPK